MTRRKQCRRSTVAFIILLGGFAMTTVFYFADKLHSGLLSREIHSSSEQNPVDSVSGRSEQHHVNSERNFSRAFDQTKTELKMSVGTELNGTASKKSRSVKDTVAKSAVRSNKASNAKQNKKSAPSATKTTAAPPVTGVSASKKEEEKRVARSKYPALSRIADQIALYWNRTDESCVVKRNNAFDVQCRFPKDGCKIAQSGTAWGHHVICENLVPDKNCLLISYGIGSDASFEADKRLRHCHGLAMDPTIPVPPQEMSETKLEFKKWGAPLLDDLGGSKKSPFIVLSAPGALQKLDSRPNAKLHVLKMDCEGCEYAIARSVKEKDSFFFQKVGQFILEIHVGKYHLQSTKELSALEALLVQLADASLVLLHARFTACGENSAEALKKAKLKQSDAHAPDRLHYSCIKELKHVGFPCRLNCINLLFARLR